MTFFREGFEKRPRVNSKTEKRYSAGAESEELSAMASLEEGQEMKGKLISDGSRRENVWK